MTYRELIKQLQEYPNCLDKEVLIQEPYDEDAALLNVQAIELLANGKIVLLT